MLTFIALAGALGIVLGFLWIRGQNKPEPRHQTRPSKVNIPTASTASVASAPAPAIQGDSREQGTLAADTRPIPETLISFAPGDSESNEQRRALGDRLKDIPRPPRSFQHLVSPAFLATATSEDLSNLVMGEPLIAAKVLARVNSPLYGLKKPVVQVGQAVTFLGLNNVRAICLHYMLDESFKAETPELQTIFDNIWNASAVASDLCFRLAQKLNLPNPGLIATYVVLSYVGHLAAALLLPKEVATSTSGASLLERARAEQEHLGMSACELTQLLMETWELPQELVDGVIAVDRVLVTSSDAIADPVKAEAAAICYFSARIGEKLVLGQQSLPLSTDDVESWGADFFHFTHYLHRPHLQGLPETVSAKDMNSALATLLSGLQQDTASGNKPTA